MVLFKPGPLQSYFICWFFFIVFSSGSNLSVLWLQSTLLFPQQVANNTNFSQ